MMACMEDNRSAEGVEHLQAAARELLLAARSFLNVVEEVVEDRDRLAGAASGVVDLLRDGLAGAIPASSPLEPWERAAWAGAAPEEADEPDEPDEPDGASAGPPVEVPASEAAPRGAATAPKKAVSKKAPAKKPPARKASPARAAAPTATSDGPPRRVRRIAVD